MHSNVKGFSLIELMVVIALIGILSALAIPSYRIYVLKSHVSEVIAAATAAEKIVSIMVQENSGITSLSSSGGACAQFATGGSHYYDPVSTPNLAGVSIDANCNITATSTSLSGVTVTITATPLLNADGSITWNCTSNSSPYAPSTCQ